MTCTATTTTTTSASRWNRSAQRLLATGLFVALAGAFVMNAEAAPMGAGMHHGGGQMMGGMGAGRMLDAVGASAEQRSQIKTIMETARSDLKPQRDTAKALNDQMRTLFTQTPVDANAAEALRQQKLAVHDQVSRRMLQAMVAASAVLTPEQRAKLAEMATQRRARMERHRGAAPK
ncbi:MAG: Spy/CpxP family protein refolding chaperone [Rubrivivax sp.]|nr:Spy/CpxP family protein refolding chaperone [Rubrivivax sp.]MBK7262906.1 Spy/CpxP family protein refolding chaperone [Rubrivivax sp.]